MCVCVSVGVENHPAFAGPPQTGFPSIVCACVCASESVCARMYARLCMYVFVCERVCVCEREKIARSSPAHHEQDFLLFCVYVCGWCVCVCVCTCVCVSV